MKSIIRLILLITVFITGTSLMQETEEGTYYVQNIHGAAVYKKPNFKSKVIHTFQTGATIHVIEGTKQTDVITIAPGLKLNGRFLETRIGNNKGYIFSTDVTRHILTMQAYNYDVYMPTIIGKLVSQRNEMRLRDDIKTSYEVDDVITEYENVTARYTQLDGCWEHLNTFKDCTFSEVYHQLVARNSYVDPNSVSQKVYAPVFIQKKENEYIFQGEGAVKELKIILVHDKNHLTILYSVK